jgi:translation initiation factor 3 subunit L
MDMSKRPYYNGQGIIACHATLHYYLAFTHVMLKRFADAITVISDVLIFINRNKQWIPRTYQEANVNKKVACMLSLLAISVALNPQTLDDSVQAILRESNVSEADFGRMQAGDLLAFEQVFETACPKFINPSFPDFESPSHVYDEARSVQLKMFMAEVKERVGIPELTGILQLCNTVNTKKLAMLAKKDEEALLPDLISFKIKSKQLKHEDPKKPPAHGVWTHTSPVNFYFRNDVLHVSEFVEVDRYGEYFISQILKYEDFLDEARQVR